MRTSTQTLDLDLAADWRLVGIQKTHRQASGVVGDVETVLDRGLGRDKCAASRLDEAWVRPSLGDAMEFALFAVALAVIGWLHLELLALIW